MLTHSLSPGKRKEDPKKNFLSLMVSSLCDWPALVEGAEEGQQPRHSNTHTSPPQPRILGLVRPGVESGSHGADHHGEPDRETGGNRVRSASVISWFASASLMPLCLCQSFSVDVKKDIHLLNTIDISTSQTWQVLTYEYWLRCEPTKSQRVMSTD